MKKIEALVGSHIKESITMLVHEANIHGKCSIEFNGIELIGKRGDSTDDLMQQWQTLSEERHQAYINSPEYAKQQKENRLEIDKLELKTEYLTRNMLFLDFTDMEAVLDWICEIQEASDRIGVKIPVENIVSHFESKGFYPNVNLDRDFIENNPENVARYIVGQALDGLQSVGSIHHMVKKFVREWKEKFTTEKVV